MSDGSTGTRRIRLRAACSASVALGYWLAIWFLLSPPIGHSRWWSYGTGIAVAVEALLKVTWMAAKESADV